MRAPGPQDLVKGEEERPPMAAVVVVEVGETRTGLCHPGYRPGIQSEPDKREARPRLRARGCGTPDVSRLTDMALIG